MEGNKSNDSDHVAVNLGEPDPLARFSTTKAEMREQIKPLFFWMYDHGIEHFSIERNGTQVVVTVNGEPTQSAQLQTSDHAFDDLVNNFALITDAATKSGIKPNEPQAT